MKKFLYFLFAFLFMTVEVNAAYPGKETSAVATVPAVNDTEVTATEYLDTTFALERKRGKVLDFIDQCFPSENSDGELLDKVCVEELRKPFRDYNAKIHYFLRKKAREAMSDYDLKKIKSLCAFIGVLRANFVDSYKKLIEAINELHAKLVPNSANNKNTDELIAVFKDDVENAIQKNNFDKIYKFMYILWLNGGYSHDYKFQLMDKTGTIADEWVPEAVHGIELEENSDSASDLRPVFRKDVIKMLHQIAHSYCLYASSLSTLLKLELEGTGIIEDLRNIIKEYTLPGEPFFRPPSADMPTSYAIIPAIT